MRCRFRLSPLLFSVALLGAPAVVAAQNPMSRAFDLERRGSYAQAAEVYRGILKDKPAEVNALLGLERALTPINRLAEILSAVQAAMAADPSSVPVYGVGLRAYAAANLLDSLPRLVELWARAAPGDETPFREWAAAALQHRDRGMARRAYQAGRERVGRPDALAAEIAQLAVAEQDWAGAVREWGRAVRQLPGYRSSAIATLGPAPEQARPVILKALEREPGTEAARIMVELRARWGDPLGALDALLRSLPSQPAQQLDALQGFLEQVRVGSTAPFLQAQARTLEELADRWAGSPQRARLRLESARAYAAAGDRPAARRMLTRLAGDSESGPAVRSGATATLIDLLVTEGRADEASAELERSRAVLPVEDFLRLRRAVAARWAQSGEIGRAESLLAADSSVDALALRGRFRLYAGDLKGASELWKLAGPFAGTREEATERSGLLALIQPIGPDTLAPFGAALRLYDGGDTLGAAKAFEQVGRGLPPDAGRPEVTLLAGRLYAQSGQPADAERVFRLVVSRDAPATSAAALLELGRLLLGLGRTADATQALEAMILDFPGGALVPQARRLLDQARNAVPRT